MITPESIDRLKAQLLTSGLSQKDQPTFQVINLLIDAIRGALIQGQVNQTIINNITSPTEEFYPSALGHSSV